MRRPVALLCFESKTMSERCGGAYSYSFVFSPLTSTDTQPLSFCLLAYWRGKQQQQKGWPRRRGVGESGPEMSCARPASKYLRRARSLSIPCAIAAVSLLVPLRQAASIHHHSPCSSFVLPRSNGVRSSPPSCRRQSLRRPSSPPPSPPRRQQVPLPPPPSRVVNKQASMDERRLLLSDDDHLPRSTTTPPPPPTTTTTPSPLLPEPLLLTSILIITTVAILLHYLPPQQLLGTEAQESWDHFIQGLVPPDYNFYESLLGGAFAGVSRGLSRIITFPLDTVKVRQQAVLRQDVDKDQLSKQASKVDTSRLFDGLLPMLLIAGPANAAFFVTHDYILDAITAAHIFTRKEMWIAELSASLLASLPANAIRIPAEVTKQRVQAGVEKTALAATKAILNEEGFTGLYVGGKVHLLRELPFNALQFLTFQNLKTQLLLEGIKVGVGQKALLGAIAAGVAGLFTQPLDVIKTSQMIDVERSSEKWTDTVARIYNKYGPIGLYLGLMPRLLLCSVGGAFYFLASEMVKGFFEQVGGGGGCGKGFHFPASVASASFVPFKGLRFW